MYEEEDDDLPMQYRRLTAHLQTQNAAFDRRLHAYLTNHVAMRTALGQAVSDAWQGQPQYPNNGQQQYMNPGMMQMPSAGQQNSMMPPQMYNNSHVSYRQSPYPMQDQAQSMRASFHSRSTSTATAHGLPYQQMTPQSHSGPNSPVEVKIEDRRSPPQAQGVLPNTPQSQPSVQQTASPKQLSPSTSRNGSTANLAKGFSTQGSPKQAPTPPQYHQPTQRSATFPSPFNPMAFNSGSNSLPFSGALPMESQQLLAGAPFDMNDPMTSMFMPSQYGTNAATGSSASKQQQPFYSYNPNGKPKSSSSTPPATFDGLNQTLAPSSLDTSVGTSYSNGYDTISRAAATDSFTPVFTPNSFGMGFDNNFNVDPFSSSANSSGHVTPGGFDDQFASFVDPGMWDEQALA